MMRSATNTTCLTMSALAIVGLTLVAPSTAVADRDDSLVGYWTYDEGGGGTVHDYSGYGNNGTLSGANWVSGVLGTALSFDGVDDYVEVADSASLDLTSAFTIEAWVKPHFVTASSEDVKIWTGTSPGAKTTQVTTEGASLNNFWIENGCVGLRNNNPLYDRRNYLSFYTDSVRQPALTIRECCHPYDPPDTLNFTSFTIQEYSPDKATVGVTERVDGVDAQYDITVRRGVQFAEIQMTEPAIGYSPRLGWDVGRFGHMSVISEGNLIRDCFSQPDDLYRPKSDLARNWIAAYRLDRNAVCGMPTLSKEGSRNASIKYHAGYYYLRVGTESGAKSYLCGTLIDTPQLHRESDSFAPGISSGIDEITDNIGMYDPGSDYAGYAFDAIPTGRYLVFGRIGVRTDNANPGNLAWIRFTPVVDGVPGSQVTVTQDVSVPEYTYEVLPLGEWDLTPGSQVQLFFDQANDGSGSFAYMYIDYVGLFPLSNGADFPDDIAATICQGVINKGDAYELSVVGGQIDCRVNKSSITASGVLQPGAWNHVAATFDGTYQRVYVNGVLTDQNLFSGPVQTNSHALFMGSNPAEQWDLFDGSLDEVRIYSRALSTAEVLDRYWALYPDPQEDTTEGDQTDVSGTSSDPVNTATGSFFHQETDLSIPSRGSPLIFTRFYNSKAAAPGRKAGKSGKAVATGRVTATSQPASAKNGERARIDAEKHDEPATGKDQKQTAGSSQARAEAKEKSK
ncbi:MAG: LamG domain-containing protein [Phycisphaerae bacterium]|nr:LamG domain-containing protein [Phycisphaerae bacterium]